MIIKEIAGERNYIKIDMEIDDNSFSKLFSDLNNNIKEFFGIEECLKNEKNEVYINSYFYKDKSLIKEKGAIVNILLRTQEILKFLIKEDIRKEKFNKEKSFNHYKNNNANDNTNNKINKTNNKINNYDAETNVYKNANLGNSGNSCEIDNDKEISFKEFLMLTENSLFKISINNNLRNIDLWRISKDSEEMIWTVDYSTIEKIHSKFFYLLFKTFLSIFLAFY